MTYEEITAMVQEIGLPCAYHHFAEGESPPPPFVVYLSPGEHTLHADNINYYSWKQLDVELYTDTKDPDAEQRVEDVLTAHEISYVNRKHGSRANGSMKSCMKWKSDLE